MPRLLPRVGLVLAGAAIALACLWWSIAAAIVGVITAALVALDMLALRPRTPTTTAGEPEKLSVDLSRRS